MAALTPAIIPHRQELAELARRYGVRRLEVFGSILRDDFDESSSDIDIVVEFKPRSGASGFRQYFDLKTKLETLLGRPVDLVELGAMENTRLKRIPDGDIVVAFRNVLAHGYAVLDHCKVYEVASKRSGELLKILEGLLAEIPEDKS
jgi:uncharacterized protein